MNVREALINLIKQYNPPRLIVSSLFYLVYGGDGLDWELSYTGLYSRKIHSIVKQLIREGVIRVCDNDRLVLRDQVCPEEDFRGDEVVSKAVKQYLLNKTVSRKH